MQSFDLPDDVSYDLIEPGLYLGSLSTAVNIETLRKLSISHILTVAFEPLPGEVLQSLPHISNFYIQVDDMPGSDLLSHLDSACEFISLALLSGGAVLVHCYFGVSRSATLVLAHLMKTRHLSVAEAMDRLRQHRSVVGPNKGFLQQLELYHSLNYSVASSSSVSRSSHCYRLYTLNMMLAVLAVEPHRLKEQLSLLLGKFSSDPPVNSNPGLMCRSCRIVLCSAASVLHHEPSRGPQYCHSGNSNNSNNSNTHDDASDDSSRRSDGCDGNSIVGACISNDISDTSKCQNNKAKVMEKGCSAGHYILPQPWMLSRSGAGPVTNKLAGSVTCSRCSAVIGRYHWLRGVACPCFNTSNNCITNRSSSSSFFHVSCSGGLAVDATALLLHASAVLLCSSPPTN